MINLVSGYEFYKLCKWNYCNRYPLNWSPEKVQENDFVFLNLDNYYMFLNTLKPGMPKFNLITHNSDMSFTIHYAKSIFPYINKIYSQNAVILDECEVFHQIPIGFMDKEKICAYFTEKENDPYLHELLINLEKDFLDKKYLCYVNFKVKSNEIYRKPCFDYFEDKNWAYKKNNIPQIKFYENVASSKFVVCPIGSGVDTHRVYESILLNSIPIVTTTFLDLMYKKMPVLIVNSWSDVTEEFLENNYEKYIFNLLKWKSENPDWIKASYWVK